MKKKFSAVLAVALMMTLVTACGTSASTGSSETASATSAEEQTLTGKAEGFGGELVVEVVKAGDTIKSVTVVSNKETPDIGGKALDQLTEAVVSANGTEVDGVSGATVTSNE